MKTSSIASSTFLFVSSGSSPGSLVCARMKSIISLAFASFFWMEKIFPKYFLQQQLPQCFLYECPKEEESRTSTSASLCLSQLNCLIHWRGHEAPVSKVLLQLHFLQKNSSQQLPRGLSKPGLRSFVPCYRDELAVCICRQKSLSTP